MKESALVSIHSTLASIRNHPGASNRTILRADLLLQNLDVLHACLCADHLPASQYGESDPTFDLSRKYGRTLTA